MKKLIGISLFSIALLAFSCQKEDLNKRRKECGKVSNPPTWKSESTPDPEVNHGTTVTGTGITDPNNDPDMNKKGNKQ